MNFPLNRSQLNQNHRNPPKSSNETKRLQKSQQSATILNSKPAFACDRLRYQPPFLILENNRRSLCYSTNSSRSKQTTRMIFWYRWQKIRPPRIHDFFSPVNFVFDSGIAMSLWKMDRKLASIPLEKFCVIVASRHRKVGLDFWLKIGALCLGQWVKIVSQKAFILIFMHFNL